MKLIWMVEQSKYQKQMQEAEEVVVTDGVEEEDTEVAGEAEEEVEDTEKGAMVEEEVVMGAEVMEEEVAEVMMVGTTMATQVLILEEVNTEKAVTGNDLFNFRDSTLFLYMH